MKKLTLPIAAVMAMSTFAIAGGDIAPVEEPMVEVVAPVVSDSGFYLGLAYAMANYTEEYDAHNTTPVGWNDRVGTYEEDYNAIMLQAGYKINKYLAVEGRYWKSFGDADWSDKGQRNGMAMGHPTSSSWDISGSYDGDFTAWGIYLKPMYPVTEIFDVYALLGYGNVEIDDGIYKGDGLDESGFQWGLGASYAFTNNISIFLDYVNMYNDDDSEFHTMGPETSDRDFEETIYTINFGVTYKF